MKQKAKRPKAALARARWKNRIVSYAQVDPRKLKANPLNWRVHPTPQRKAMVDAFEQIGELVPAIVNKRTGNIIDGHMRVELALEHHEPTVPVIYVDMTLDEEKLALTTINPLAELAATDPEKLAELLGAVPRKGGALDDLLAALEEQAHGTIVKGVGGGSSGARAVATNSHAMRMMLAVGDIATIERALAMTGLQNRGAALLAICNQYLGEYDSADAPERQHDAEPQGELEDQLAQAITESAGNPGNPRRPRARVGTGLP